MNRQPADYKLYHRPSKVFNLACYCLFLFDKSPLETPEFCTLFSLVIPCLLHNYCTLTIGHDERSGYVRRKREPETQYHVNLLVTRGIRIRESIQAYSSRFFSCRNSAKKFRPGRCGRKFLPGRIGSKSSGTAIGSKFLFRGRSPE